MENLSLHDVVREGKTEPVRALLSQGVSVNELDPTTELTLVHLAVRAQNVDVLRLLIEAKAELDKQDHEGNTPLLHAVFYGYHEMVRILVDAGASVNVRNDRDFTALYWTLCRPIKAKGPVDENDLRILEILLEAKAEVNVKREDGKTPLHLAVNLGNLEVVKLLLGAGARVNERRADGKTALHLATISGNLEILKTLIKVQEVDVNIKDNLERTPVEYALDYWNFVAIRILVDAGADVNSKSTELERAALHLAVEKNDITMIEYLLNRGACVDVRDRNGQTPLHCATTENQGESHLNAVRMLLDKNADADARDSEGKSPLDYGETSAVMFEFLLKHLAMKKMGSSTKLEESGDNEKSAAEDEQRKKLDELERKIEDFQEKILNKKFDELEGKIEDLQRRVEAQGLDEFEQKIEDLERKVDNQKLDYLEGKIKDMQRKIESQNSDDLKKKIEELQKKVVDQRSDDLKTKIEDLQKNIQDQKSDDVERKIEDMQGKVSKVEANSTLMMYSMLLLKN